MEIKICVPLEHKGFWGELLPFGRILRETEKFVHVLLVDRQLELDSDDVECICDLLMGIMDNTTHELMLWGTAQFSDSEDEYETFSLCNRETFHHDTSLLRSDNLSNQIHVWSCARACDAITRDPKHAEDVISACYTDDPFVPLSDAERLDWIAHKPTRAHVLEVVRRGNRLHAVDLLHRLLQQPDYQKFEEEARLLYAASFRR